MTATPTTPVPAGQAAQPVTWSDKPHPTDGRPFYTLTFRLTKYTHYKPDGRRQMGGAKGRWQKQGEYGGWDNCATPTGPWILAGRTVPDALGIALAAPSLLTTLCDLLAAADCALPLAESWADGKSRSHVDHEVARDLSEAIERARAVVVEADGTAGQDGRAVG